MLNIGGRSFGGPASLFRRRPERMADDVEQSSSEFRREKIQMG
jgi:hypothetical protein